MGLECPAFVVCMELPITTIHPRIRLKIGRLFNYLKIYFWWIKSRDAKNHSLLELSRSSAVAMGVKPFRRIKIAYSENVVNAATVGFLCSTLVISQGMLDTLTLDEIRAVIFHEYAHCKQKHHLKLTAASLSLIIIGLLAPLYLALSTEYALSLLITIFLPLLYISTLLFVRYLARKFEEEADTIAVKSLENPKTYIQALQKIALRSSASSNSFIERLFSSHPPYERRLHKLISYITS